MKVRINVPERKGPPVSTPPMQQMEIQVSEPKFTDTATEVLQAQYEEIGQELERRRLVNEAKQQVDVGNKQFLAAMGRSSGDPWVQPQGAHDAYPLDWRTSHADKVWESTISGNVWEPGVSGWREVMAEVTEPPADGTAPEPSYPEFVQPTGSHDAYGQGDRVMFKGQLYESTIEGNVWTPEGYPAGWKVVTA